MHALFHLPNHCPGIDNLGLFILEACIDFGNFPNAAYKTFHPGGLALNDFQECTCIFDRIRFGGNLGSFRLRIPGRGRRGVLPPVRLFPVQRSVSLHILHYLIVGGANSVFYSASILDLRRQGLTMLPVMGGLYLFLYTALQSEDYALLIGSVGLFLVLAAVMILTRKVDWNRLGGSLSRSAGS
jgi:hypothetical protein